MPWTLDRSAHHGPARQGTALVRTTVVKRNITLLGTPEYNAFIAQVYEFHLVYFQFIFSGHCHRSIAGCGIFLFPFACPGVARVNAYLVAVYQCSAHPACYEHEDAAQYFTGNNDIWISGFAVAVKPDARKD